MIMNTYFQHLLFNQGRKLIKNKEAKNVKSVSLLESKELFTTALLFKRSKIRKVKKTGHVVARVELDSLAGFTTSLFLPKMWTKYHFTTTFFFFKTRLNSESLFLSFKSLDSNQRLPTMYGSLTTLVYSIIPLKSR